MNRRLKNKTDCAYPPPQAMSSILICIIQIQLQHLARFFQALCLPLITTERVEQVLRTLAPILEFRIVTSKLVSKFSFFFYYFIHCWGYQGTFEFEFSSLLSLSAPITIMQPSTSRHIVICWLLILNFQCIVFDFSNIWYCFWFLLVIKTLSYLYLSIKPI